MFDEVTADQVGDITEDRAGDLVHLSHTEVRIHQIHTNRGGIKESLEPSVAGVRGLFRVLALGDFDEGDDNAVDRVLCGAIGADAHDERLGAILERHVVFDDFAIPLHLFHVGLDRGVVQLGDELRDRATAI